VAHRYDQRGRIVMTPPPHLSPQLHLPLLNSPLTVLPPDEQTELILALVELLLGAARALTPDKRDGGLDERETHH
jgi:hypothetical protein